MRMERGGRGEEGGGGRCLVSRYTRCDQLRRIMKRRLSTEGMRVSQHAHRNVEVADALPRVQVHGQHP